VAQHSFWVIVDGDTPTSFRSRQQEDLLPTLTQLKRTQPDVRLMWFERGRLWASPTAARDALIARRTSPIGRTRAWRPGGEHKDPRAKYDVSRDERRARFKTRHERDRRDGGPDGRRGDAGHAAGGDRDRKPQGDRPLGDRPRGDRPAWRPKGPGRPPFKPYGERPHGGDRPFKPRGDRPFKPGGDRPFADRPRGDRPPGDRPRGGRPPADRAYGGDRPFRPKGDRPFKPQGDRPAWRPNGPGRPRDEPGGRPEGRRPFGDRPQGDRPTGFGSRPWRPKKPGGTGRPWQAGKPWKPKKPKDGD